MDINEPNKRVKGFRMGAMIAFLISCFSFVIFPLFFIVSCDSKSARDTVVESLTLFSSGGEGLSGGGTGSGGGVGTNGPTSSVSLQSAQQLYAPLSEVGAHANLICNVPSGSSGDPLAIAKSYPATGANGVAVNSSFVAYFNKPLDCGALGNGNLAFNNPNFAIQERATTYSGNKQYLSLAHYYRCECNRLELVPVRNFVTDEEYFVELTNVPDLTGKLYSTYEPGVFPTVRNEFLHFRTGSNCAVGATTAIGAIDPTLGAQTVSVCSRNPLQDELNAPLDAQLTITFNQNLDCTYLFPYYTNVGAPLYNLFMLRENGNGSRVQEKFNFTCSGNTLTISPCELRGDIRYNFSLFGDVKSASGIGLMTGITTKDPALSASDTNPLNAHIYSLSFKTAPGGVPFVRTTGLCAVTFPGEGTSLPAGGGGVHDSEYNDHELNCTH